jgi:hypothetical protein
MNNCGELEAFPARRLRRKNRRGKIFSLLGRGIDLPVDAA